MPSKHREKLRESAIEAMMWSLVALLVWREAWQEALWVASIVAGVRILVVFALLCDGWARRRIETKRRDRLGANAEADGGPTDAEIADGCDCQRPHGEGVRGVSMECPIHG